MRTTQSTDRAHALTTAIVIGVGAYLAPRAFLEALAASTRAGQKEQEADAKLLQKQRLSGVVDCPSKVAHRSHYSDERCAARVGALGHAGFSRLHLFSLGTTEGLNDWRGVFAEGRNCGDAYFVVRGDGIGLVVKNTFWGRLGGRLGIAHARALNRFDLWKPNHKGTFQ